MREKKGTEIARCRLLQEISGVYKPQLCQVRRDACQACCESFTPSHAEINPVIASLLYLLADRVIVRGGVAGCPTGQAVALQSWAKVNLEIEHPTRHLSSKPDRVTKPCAHLGPKIRDQEPGVGSQGSGGKSRELATVIPSSSLSTPVFECRHPNHQETTLSACDHCRDWAAKPGPAPSAIDQIVPPPRKRWGPRIRRWAVAVTTAPRREPTLRLCLDSLWRAGWESPRLFVDSAMTVPERYAGLPITLREDKLGAWPNYYLALIELLMRDPEADGYLLVQDDAIFFDQQNLREHLEQILWPGDPIGLVSLYCSKAYTRAKPGWHRKKGCWSRGALAFVFPRELAKRFICDPVVLEHRWRGPKLGLVNIDNVIGEWALRQKTPIYYPTPSLVQHIGETSTIWLHDQAVGIRRADRFAGDVPKKSER